MDKFNKFNKLNENLDVSEEEFKTLQELEKNDDGFKDEENTKYKKAGSLIAPLGGGNALYFDYSDEYPRFEDVIAIQFQKAGKIYWYYYPEQKIKKNNLKQGDIIVAYSERGMELAVVLNKSLDDFKKQNKINFIKNGFIRKATPDDLKQALLLEENAKNAKKVAERLNKELGIKMKIVKVKYTLDDIKVIFYFSANGRIDFRELIKKLAFELRRRIEMRQIGVRDVTKIMGGIGPCGRELCCRNYMHNFLPVTIKMAKDQNFSLNPNKISGICGRLFCCLGYENPIYEELRKHYPEEESYVVEKTTGRKGIVKKVNVIAKNITVFFPENHEKKEKFEEKIFSESLIEFKENCWFVLSPQQKQTSNDFNMLPPAIPKEKELLLAEREDEFKNQDERKKRTDQKEFRKNVRHAPNQQNYKKHTFQQENFSTNSKDKEER